MMATIFQRVEPSAPLMGNDDELAPSAKLNGPSGYIRGSSAEADNLVKP
ncbi:hypothetical protein SAMN02927900_05960 [Rhizobium mongolense subsp. loessense]|uniref:Uncharacterized protein n=1 Tax=Rhizobium mongolense subsp. loessense TaxID=158890 RepID=A0A1G4U3W9_9HYPH|nr:hypothetical protein SAMN02927900_05960 [Rhizobium mongolense subsp. loessense]